MIIILVGLVTRIGSLGLRTELHSQMTQEYTTFQIWALMRILYTILEKYDISKFIQLG
jgi:N-acetyl-anhydromuramyl-L-alanine amidase AmpD